MIHKRQNKILAMPKIAVVTAGIDYLVRELYFFFTQSGE